MKLKNEIFKYALLSLLLFFFFALTGLKVSVTPVEAGNSSALTHAVLAENATSTT